MRTYASRALEHPGRYIFPVSDPALRTVAGSYCAVLVSSFVDEQTPFRPA
jgi:hypothetical protein